MAIDRALQLPSLVLLDEVGTGTDPNEGGALATAVVNHVKQRGAHLIATTYVDAVKTWGTATEGVTVAGFAFDPQNYAPRYRRVHPLVLKFAPATENRGGGGATVLELKE